MWEQIDNYLQYFHEDTDIVAEVRKLPWDNEAYVWKVESYTLGRKAVAITANEEQAKQEVLKEIAKWL